MKKSQIIKSHQKLFSNFRPLNSNILKPKSAMPRKNHFMNNINSNINKNVIKPSNIALNSNFPSNKTYNAFNVFKKKLERTQSPLLRTSVQNNAINFMQKGKQRYVSKSPILSKGSMFNRYKMNIFSGMSNSASANSNNNNNNNNKKNIKRKTPIKNNNNKKPLINGKNNVNNIRTNKGSTLIQGEFIQDSASGGHININNVNNINTVNKRNVNNNNNNINPLMNKNMKPVYNPQNLKIESNNALLNIQAEPSNKEKDKEKEKEPTINHNVNKKNKDKEKESNDNNSNNIIAKTNNENTNNSNINANINNAVLANNNNNINEQKKNSNENKKSQRSQSTGIQNPLQKDTKEKDKEKDKENKEKDLQQLPMKIKKEKEKKKSKEEEPHKYVTKIIKDILPYTHVGFDGEEPKENNQDNYFIYKNFMNKKDYIYMSVCDGHGIEGHFVSDFMKEILPYDMSENLKLCNLMTENEKEREKIHQIIKETFILANEKLVYNEEINSLFSGSTCVSVIYTPEKLIVPNIGDSRAVLGRLVNKEKNEYKAINLSRDHKPTEKDEAQRIIENDGRIQPFTEEGEFVGPERVWIKEEEVPGLAMTRSFGDRVAATVGVMSEPEIKEFYFDEGDKFMIIASDGIWEFISSQECVDIIKDYYDKNDLKGCCEYLYQESSKRWLKEEEVIDDTTLILVFFE